MARPPSRRPGDPRSTAEAAFKAATTKTVEPAAPTALKARPLPNAKEMVTLRIDRTVLEHFQAGGPGWQDRINEALRKATGQEPDDGA